MSEEKETKQQEHINLVFIGHVDAGKSTLSGQILLLTGQVDKRTIEKYEKEAKEKNHESWWLAYILDIDEAERARGKTVECGKAEFRTDKKRVTLLDAPGHKGFVPAMIQGAAQADVAGLVISARKGEFEAGFERGGQTREHLMLSRTLGVQKLLVLINKMDDPTVNWSKDRYDEIVSKLEETIDDAGYDLKKDVVFLPIAGYTGANIKEKRDSASWVTQPTLFEAIDSLPPIVRMTDKPLRLPVAAKGKDERGQLFVAGKIESGALKTETEYILVPSYKKFTLTGIELGDGTPVTQADSGENVTIYPKGIEEEDIFVGQVICAADKPCYQSMIFEVQMMILSLPDSSPVISRAYRSMLHIHTAAVECQLVQIDKTFGRKGKVLQENPDFIGVNANCVAKLKVSQPIAIEKFSEIPQLGRFTLREKTNTVAIGKVLRIKPIA